MVDYYLARISEFIKEEMTAAQRAGAVAIIAFVVLGWLFSLQQSRYAAKPELIPVMKKAGAKQKQTKLLVHVAGEVKSPGLYELPEGQRVADAIKIAGGKNEVSDLDALNLAEPLMDGMKITVPAIAVTPGIEDSSKPAANDMQSLVNINNAGENDLDELPGIGPATAKKIIDFRNSNGRFKSIEDLKNVKGIGQKKFEELKGKVTIY